MPARVSLAQETRAALIPKMITYEIAAIQAGATLIIQARTNKDLLDCEALEYLGAFNGSAETLRARRVQFLNAAQRKYPARNFKRVRFDIEAQR